MKGGDADEFIDYLMDGGASVRHKGYVYHFSGFVYHPGQHKWRVSIEKYRWTKEPFEDFMELVYYYTSDEEEDCINHLTEDILWDGKSFYQLEKLSPGSTGKNLPSHHLTAPSAPLQPCGKRTAEVRVENAGAKSTV